LKTKLRQREKKYLVKIEKILANQADKPANKRQVLRALVALSFYIVTNNNKQL